MFQDPTASPNPTTSSSRLEDLIIQNNDYNLPDNWGISMNVPVKMFGILDFEKADTIYRIGYNTTMQMMDSIKSRVTSRVDPQVRNLRRAVFKSQTPYVRFDSVIVTGGTRSQNEYIKYLFTHNSPDTFGLERARDSYYRAITPGKLENLVPEATHDKSDGLFDLSLKATVKDNFRVGFGGYVSSSTSSMLFLSGGYNTMSFNSLDANINGWIGQSYMAALLNARISLLTAVPSSLKIRAGASRQKFYENDHLFFKDNTPISIVSNEVYSQLIYSVGVGRRGKFDAGAGFGHLIDRFFQNNRVLFSEHNRDRVLRNLMQAFVSYDYTTLDNINYPASGAQYKIKVMGVKGRYHYDASSSGTLPSSKGKMDFIQAELNVAKYFDLGKHFALGG